MTIPIRAIDGTEAQAAPDISSNEQPQSIIMLLGGLGVGGAEHQAIALAGALQRRGHRLHVVTLADGPLRSAVAREGLALEVLTRPFSFSPAAVPALAGVFRRLKPDVVYAFLDVQWLLALAARVLAPGPRIVLGLRSSQYFTHAASTRSRVVGQLTRRVAGFADLLVANSMAGLDDFRRQAPASPRGIVVSNGIDQRRFAPDATGRTALRRFWSLPADALVIGHVGRHDEVKNHEMLIDAFSVVAQSNPKARLVCVGDGSPSRIASLQERAQRLGVSDQVCFAGRRTDLSAVYSAMDVLALTSKREGFPSVVAEAMLCGVPAVVTDTGASAEIVGGLGEVAPADDTASFVAALQRLIARRSAALSARCRFRILANYTLDQCAALTSAAFQMLPSSSRDR
jgi:glycosyltransferase involved in cell wall biosynthesis